MLDWLKVSEFSWDIRLVLIQIKSELSVLQSIIFEAIPECSSFKIICCVESSLRTPLPCGSCMNGQSLYNNGFSDAWLGFAILIHRRRAGGTRGHRLRWGPPPGRAASRRAPREPERIPPAKCSRRQKVAWRPAIDDAAVTGFCWKCRSVLRRRVPAAKSGPCSNPWALLKDARRE